MRINEVMTTEVVSVGPATPLKEVAQLLVERRISGVPVVDDLGALVGVVSEADFVAKEAGLEAHRRSWLGWLTGLTAEERHEELLVAARTAGEAMTSPVISIGPHRPLNEAARLMEQHGINRLPVLDGGRLVGIVTRADIVHAYARTDADLHHAAVEALRAVDGLEVVAVREGVVILRGTVASRALYDAVRRIVLHLDGVVAVEDTDVTWEPDPRSVTVV